MFFIRVSIFCFFPLLTFCKSTSQLGANKNNSTTPIEIPNIQIAPGASPLPIAVTKDANGNEQYTFQGNNRHPKFTIDDKGFYFTSALRASHRDSQIYSFSFSKAQETRLSFNDGISTHPTPDLTRPVIYFSSTTDEQKEFPQKIYPKEYQFLKQNFWDFEDSQIYLNSELYYIELNEKVHAPTRLTHRFGFEGFPNQAEDSLLQWVQKSRDEFIIFQLDMRHRQSPLKQIFKQKNPIWEPQWNEKSHHWAWISWVPTTSVTQNQIYLYETGANKTPEALTLPPGVYHDLTWVKGQNLLLVSALLTGDKDFNIYQYDVAQKCLRSYLKNTGDDIDISINQAQTEVLYAHRTEKDKNSHFQIMKKSFQLSTSPCITAVSSL